MKKREDLYHPDRRALALRSGTMDDWFVIEWADGGDVSSASVEGNSEDMRAIARAIERAESIARKRCAVTINVFSVRFHSPRNSTDVEGPETHLDDAFALSQEIRKVCGLDPDDPGL